MTVGVERAPKVLHVNQSELGREIKARREALGLTGRQFATLAHVDRGRLAKFEKGEGKSNARPSWVGGVLATLARLEEEIGGDTPDLITNTIELPDGTRVTFAGPADGVAEAATRFLASRDTGA